MQRKKLIIGLLVLAAIFALISIFLYFYGLDLFSNSNVSGGVGGGNIQLTVLEQVGNQSLGATP